MVNAQAWLCAHGNCDFSCELIYGFHGSKKSMLCMMQCININHFIFQSIIIKVVKGFLSFTCVSLLILKVLSNLADQTDTAMWHPLALETDAIACGIKPCHCILHTSQVTFSLLLHNDSFKSLMKFDASIMDQQHLCRWLAFYFWWHNEYFASLACLMLPFCNSSHAVVTM